MMKRLILLCAVAALLAVAPLSVVAQDGNDIFANMTPEELFPGAVNEVEAETAYQALLDANLPDVREFFEGQTLTVAVQQAGVRGGISGPYYYWRPAFEAITGATLEIVEIPSSDLFSTTATDFLTGLNTYDVINVGAWYYGDYIPNGWIVPTDCYWDDAAAEGCDYSDFSIPMPAWDPADVAAPLAALHQWEGRWYGVLNDGDAQMLYFRRDILEDPEWQATYEAETGEPMPYPMETWQDLLDITTFFNDRDWNGDGDEDDGISLHLAAGGQGMFHFMSLSAPFTITPADGDAPPAVSTTDNIYWFDPDTMEPLINSPGHVQALEFLQALAATGSEAQFGWELAEAWDNFLNDNAVATFSWGDVISLSQDPSRSVITGNLGGARIPCSSVWYDRATDSVIEDAENPNCVGNTTGGSWHPVLSAFSDTPDLGYYLMAMHAVPSINFWNVTYGWTGVDPSSLSHLFPPRGTATIEDYADAGFDASDAEQGITGYGENLFSHPIYQTYLRIPGTIEFWDILDVRLNQVMTNQATAQEGLDLIAEEWAAINEDFGVDAQLELYQAAIGYTGE
ncbi:MAG: extracellular solute-binding protein [Chloroflexi bacterium]|nr:extracellular solute-binding protein [Chloroflexota bacterium]